jgi:ribosomal protein S19E (S16A)
LVETLKPGGRRVTREGKKLLQGLAGDVQKELAKDFPELGKYQKGE